MKALPAGDIPVLRAVVAARAVQMDRVDLAAPGEQADPAVPVAPEGRVVLMGGLEGLVAPVEDQVALAVLEVDRVDPAVDREVPAPAETGDPSSDIR